ncbi:tetratricopeptide repeat protein [Bradyrhizobium sp. 2TAF24]
MSFIERLAPSASDLDAGIAACSRLIADNPQNAGAYRERGLLLARSGDDDEALDDLDRAVALDPADAQAFALRGLIWETRGDVQRALSNLNIAIGLAPDSSTRYKAHRDRVLASAAIAGERSPQAADAPAAATLRRPAAPVHEAATRSGPPRGPSADPSLSPLIAACRQAGIHSQDFEAFVVRNGFGPSAAGLAKAVHDAFVAAVDAGAKLSDPDAPWQAVRGLALDLNYRSSAEAAVVILEGMLAVADRTPPTSTLLDALKADRRAIRHGKVQALLHGANAAGRWDEALVHIDELLYIETDAEERGRLRIWRNEIAAWRRRRTMVRWAWGIGIVAIVVVASLLSRGHLSYWPGRTSSSVPSSPAPSPVSPWRNGAPLPLAR